MPQDKRDSSLTSGFGMAMGLAIEMVVTTLVGTGLGWLMSKWLGNPVLWLVIGTLLGGVAAINLVFFRWKTQK